MWIFLVNIINMKSYRPFNSFRLYLLSVEKAREATDRGRGKHHIGDFLPPEELDKFVEKVVAVKEGRTPGQYAMIHCGKGGRTPGQYAMIHYSILWEEGKMPGQYGRESPHHVKQSYSWQVY